MKTLQDMQFEGKRVLIRADLNVPVNEAGEISDDNRIRQFIPTLQYIVKHGGRAIVMSHFGRPSGERDPKSSLRPAATRLSELLASPVTFSSDCIGDEAQQKAFALENGEVLVLENLRFHSEEKNNGLGFAKQLAALGEMYVNDAFATAHRAHASIVGVPALLPSKCVGLLMQREIDYYHKALVNPRRPLCVVLGGAKVSTKLQALLHLSKNADKIIIGGAMANTFLAAQGFQMGRSLYEPPLFGKVLEVVASLARRGAQLYLPVDFIVAPGLNVQGLGRAVPAQEIPADSMALDIGPASSLLFREALQTAETIVWNGPMGAFEKEEFSKGTTDMIETLASAHGLKVVGGGDTDAAIHQMELGHKFDFISTGGGAFLALLEGEPLPAIRALQ